MNRADGPVTKSIILLNIDQPTWSDVIYTALSQLGYTLSKAAAYAEADRLIKATQPTGIIILAADASFDLFAGLDQSALPPLKILITDMASVEALHKQGADIVLAPNPTLIGMQLQSLLNINAQNLKRQYELNQEIQRHKRTNNEVEILKNAIVRNVSHELKTPLLQVKSAVSLLSEDVGSTKLIEYATDATARLELLIRNITLLGGSLDINPGPVIIRDAVEHSHRNLRRTWQRKDEVDRIKVRLEDNLPPVLADRQGLSTVLQLLMDNGLKFSQEQVEVCAEQVQSEVRISISDYGIGIAQDNLHSIFDMFYQVDASSTRRYGGTGVGLAIVRLILERHNSKITVESTEGKGSTFSFMLPVVKL